MGAWASSSSWMFFLICKYWGIIPSSCVFTKNKQGQVCTASSIVAVLSRCPTHVGIFGILWYSINTEHVTMNTWMNKFSLERKRNQMFSRNILFRLKAFKHLIVVCCFVRSKNISSSKVKVKVLVTQSCLTVCDCMDCSPPDSSLHGILQARILEWVAMPFSRGSSRPTDRIQVFCIASRLFTIWVTREALLQVKSYAKELTKLCAT